MFNFKHQTNKRWNFFEQGWGKFKFGKNFLRLESPTSRQKNNCSRYFVNITIIESLL